MKTQEPKNYPFRGKEFHTWKKSVNIATSTQSCMGTWSFTSSSNITLNHGSFKSY